MSFLPIVKKINGVTMVQVIKGLRDALGFKIELEMINVGLKLRDFARMIMMMAWLIAAQNRRVKTH